MWPRRDAAAALQARLEPVCASLGSWTREQLPRGTFDWPCAPLSLDGGHDGDGGAPPPPPVAFPFTLRPRVCARGVDVELQLLRVTVGEPAPPRRRRAAAAPPPAWAARADRAAGLLYARVLFPDAAAPAVNAAVLAWAASAAAAALRGAPPAGVRRAARRRGPAARALAAAARGAAAAARGYGEPAAALALLGLLWAVAAPASFHAAQCAAALVPVLAGYNATARACLLGRAPDPEAAWHARHKWAARRCAPLLAGELPAGGPPLGALAGAAAALSICVGAAVDGVAFDAGAWGDAAPPAPRVWATVARRQGRPAAGVEPRPGGPAEPGPPAAAAAPEGARVSPVPVLPLAALPRARDGPLMDSPYEFCSSPKGGGPAPADAMHPLNWLPPAAAGPPSSSSITTSSSGGASSFAEPPPQDLQLYGRADHAAALPPLTAAERAALALRATQLFLLFAPFLLLGPVLLALAASAPPARRAALRAAVWRLLLAGVRRANSAALTKWAQWSATREDIFPADMCAALAVLHDRAPRHSAAVSCAAVEAALRAPLAAVFSSFEPEAVASGSVAQVHRATLRATGEAVAVKVRHPGVAARIASDFRLLLPLAAAATRAGLTRGLDLHGSLRQFSATMTAQADLRVEAAHLARFAANFGGVGSAVVVPRLAPGMCTADVLVESFEPGASVATFMRAPPDARGRPPPVNARIVALGVDAYLKMVLSDGFVHTDLHPGNILARVVPAPGGRDRLQIVLLDFGLAEELEGPVREHFVGFLLSIAAGDGAAAARHLLAWSDDQTCADPGAFAADVAALFARACSVHAPGGIDLDAVMKAVLRACRAHAVAVDSRYAALVAGVVVLVGFATGLDARVNLMDAATPCFLAHWLTGRVVGRLYL